MCSRLVQLLSIVLLLVLPACQPVQEGPGASGSGSQEASLEATPHVMASSPVEAGAYLARVGGCHDCHTAGYAENGGQAPREDWLKGWAVGFRGPWGTTYPRNLRLTVQRMTEEEWVEFLGAAQMNPPMPWFNLHDMSEPDRRALYRFIESLGEPGDAAPSNVPPGQEPETPFVPFTPVEPGGR